MKRALLLFIAAGFIVSTMAQIKPFLNNPQSPVKALKPVAQIDGQVVGLQTPNTIVVSDATLADEVIMTSLYDLQTNSSNQQRLYRYEDGTMAGVAIFSHQNDYADRGTGYNYFDGTSWATPPATRIETATRTGWPAYAPLGPNGEIVVAHSSGTLPLYINRRDTRGTGTWTQTELAAPTGAAGLLWPRMVTSGDDHMSVHIFTMTSPTPNGGVVWNDMDGALIYNRSLDGGDTWDGWVQMDGMTSSEYLGFSGDAYAWAQPVGNTLAFVVGDSFNDEFIMKSEDNGDTWTKTIIWDCPFDLWTGVDTTGHFYSSDGTSAAAIGPDGKVHVLFGLGLSSGDVGGATYWTINNDGMIYWNEDMPELPQEMDPDDLYASGNYIGWVKDTNVFYIPIAQYAFYYGSMSSMPTLVVDDANQVFAFWSSMTMNMDPNNFLLRHIFARASVDGGTTWRDSIVDITGEFVQQWTEFVYATAASRTTHDKIYLIDQDDDLAGVYLKSTNSGYQGQMEITTNNLTVMEIDKNDIIQWGVGVNNKPAETFTVSQNYPNPVNGRTAIRTTLTHSGNLSLTITNVVGQQVMKLEKGTVNSGNHQFIFDGSGLPAGIYFYTVTVNNQSVTKRMIVE